MTLAALGLVLAAAGMHAAWNFLAKRSGGGTEFVWLLATASVILYLPVAAAAFWLLRPSFSALDWLFILGTSILHIGYFVSLQKGYQRGDLSLVYPLARGSGPLLTAVGAVVLFGERPGWLVLVGIALIVGSVFVLTGGGRLLARRDAGAGAAVRYGLLTGAFIATYTLWDKYAVAVLLINPLLYDWLSNVGRSLFMTPWALRGRGELKRLWQRQRMTIIAIAALSSLSYILILTAMSFTDVTYIAPAREISIVFAAFLGARLLGEGDSRRRFLAAGGMAAGVICLALG